MPVDSKKSKNVDKYACKYLNEFNVAFHHELR